MPKLNKLPLKAGTNTITKDSVLFPVHTLPEEVQSYVRERVILNAMNAAVSVQRKKVKEREQGVRHVCQALPNKRIEYMVPDTGTAAKAYGGDGRIQVVMRSRRGTLTEANTKLATSDYLAEAFPDMDPVERASHVEELVSRVWDTRPTYQSEIIEHSKLVARKDHKRKRSQK